MEDVSTPGDEFFFLCLNLGVIPKNSTSWEIHLHLAFQANWNNRDKVWRDELFNSDVAVAVVAAKAP